MMTSLVAAIMRNDELRDPKSYKVKFIATGTLMGDLVGQGWYIVAFPGPTLGPFALQQEAEDSLIATLEHINSKPFSEDEKANARASWKVG